MSYQILMAVAKIKAAKIHFNTLALIRLATRTPRGEANVLAMTMITEGQKSTCPVNTFPTVAPMDETNVMAIDEAIATRVGMFRITSMMGIRMNAPAAPTIPDSTPTTKAERTAIALGNVTSS